MSAAMRAALRADTQVFKRVNDALPELLETGASSGVSSHDLRHAALVMRIVELEWFTGSVLSNNNLFNLIVSDRFMDVPDVNFVVTPAPSPRSLSNETQSKCNESNPLCVYAESVSISWALAKIAQVYRSGHLLNSLREVVTLPPLPALSPRSFVGKPLFKSKRSLKYASKLPLRKVMQDYLVLYRQSMLAVFEREPPTADDTWSLAVYAMLLADRANLTVKAVMSGLRIRHLSDVDVSESKYLEEFVRNVRPHGLPVRDDDEWNYDDDWESEMAPTLHAMTPYVVRNSELDMSKTRSTRSVLPRMSRPTPASASTSTSTTRRPHPPDRVTHVSLYNLGYPSSETADLR